MRIAVGQQPTKVAGKCLNPCFWGRYADRMIFPANKDGEVLGLNPCFWGRYADREYENEEQRKRVKS